MADQETKPAAKASGPIQFTTLNRWRRERAMLEVFLVNGQRLVGRIRSFDRFSMLLEMPQGACFVFHHTVSTVQPAAKGARRAAPPAKGRPREAGSDSRRPSAPRERFERQPRDLPEYTARDEDRRRPAEAPQVTVVRRTRRVIQRDPE
ncbi:MAG: RNA chaperone Hfq [Burkholderiaceae bacterium]